MDVSYSDPAWLGPCVAVAVGIWGDSLGSDVQVCRLRQLLKAAQTPAQWQHSTIGRSWPEDVGSLRTDAGDNLSV